MPKANATIVPFELLESLASTLKTLTKRTLSGFVWCSRCGGRAPTMRYCDIFHAPWCPIGELMRLINSDRNLTWPPIHHKEPEWGINSQTLTWPTPVNEEQQG